MVIREHTEAGPAFVAVTTLFFAWGFITSLVDPLVAAVKGIFTLSDVEAQLTTFAFFIAYGLCSFPAAQLLARLNAVTTILMALGTMILGCLVMLGAANLAIFPLVLAGLFILASGVTTLQVAANPLAAALGNPRRSHFRLTLSQTFNSVGTFLGPLVGAHLFLAGIDVKHGAVVTYAARGGALDGIDTAYLWLAGLVAVLFVFFYLNRGTVARAAPKSSTHKKMGSQRLLREALSSRWAIFGAGALFLYVGAEVAIGTQMAFFLNQDSIWGASNAPFHVPMLGYAMGSDGVAGVSLQEAGKAVAFYWGGAMIGRAIGAILLNVVRASTMLGLFAAVAAFMCCFAIVIGGVEAGFVVLSIGLFNSIMFPVIFTLTLERSTATQEATSGLLCTAIIGGAFVPLLVGAVSGSLGYAFALIVPALCYGSLCIFAIFASRASRSHAIPYSQALTTH